VCRLIHAGSVADHSGHKVQRLQNCPVCQQLMSGDGLVIEDTYINMLTAALATPVQLRGNAVHKHECTVVLPVTGTFIYFSFTAAIS